MSSSLHWDLVIEELTKHHEFRCIAPDLRGFGNSSYNKKIEAITDFSNDLRLFVDALSLKSFVLFGWSLGGVVCQRFTIDHPEYVQRLILLASGGPKGYPLPIMSEDGKPTATFPKSYAELADEKQPWIKRHLSLVAGDKVFVKALWDIGIYKTRPPAENRYDAYLSDIVKERCYVEALWALGNYNVGIGTNGIVEGTGEITKLKDVPILVYHGEQDIICPKIVMDPIINLADARVKTILDPACGHSPPTDNLEGLVKAVIEFIHA
jgi:pimeloyl-ACP methyl ester carboxylesterase